MVHYRPALTRRCGAGKAAPGNPGHLNHTVNTSISEVGRGPPRHATARRHRRFAVSALAASISLAAVTPALAQGPASVQVRMDLEVLVHQEFVPEFDGGHWSVSYRHAGPWTLRRDEGTAETALGILGALAGGAGRPTVSEVTGSAYEICMDGNADRWRTDYEPPVQVDPGTLTGSGQGDLVLLWYGAPIVEMYHPGHSHIPTLSECHTMDPGQTELWLFTSDLEMAGAETNAYGDFLISTFPWEDVVAVSEGRRESLPVHAGLQGPGVSFEVRGVIASP